MRTGRAIRKFRALSSRAAANTVRARAEVEDRARVLVGLAAIRERSLLVEWPSGYGQVEVPKSAVPSFAVDVRIEESSHDVVFAVWDRVALAVWRNNTTVGGVRRAERIFQEYVMERGEPILMLTMIEAKATLPSLEARIELASVLKRADGLVERSALVIEGDGFRAASIRAVVKGISLFSKQLYPHAVFGSLSAAAQFLTQGSGGAPAPELIVAAAQLARRSPTREVLAPHPPSGNGSRALRTRQ